MGVLFSPDGKTLTAWDGTADMGRHLRQYDARTGKQLWSVPDPQHTWLTLAGLGPNGRTLFLGSDGIEHHLLSLQPLRQLAAIPYEVSTAKCLGKRQYALSPDGRLLALVLARFDDKPEADLRVFISVRESRGGKEIARIEVADGDDYELAFSPDGSVLAYAGVDDLIHLQVIGAAKPYRDLVGHRGSVNTLAFSPDGSKLLSGSDDTTILIWDVADRPRQRLAEPTPAELPRLWADLAGDAPAAHRAMKRLAAAPALTTPFLKEHLRPIANMDKLIAARIADLDNEDFDKRQQAEQDLTHSGDQAEAALQELLERDSPLEVSLRAKRILESLNTRPISAEELRRHRALAVLERIGSPAAKDILAALARGAPLRAGNTRSKNGSPATGLALRERGRGDETVTRRSFVAADLPVCRKCSGRPGGLPPRRIYLETGRNWDSAPFKDGIRPGTCYHIILISCS